MDDQQRQPVFNVPPATGSLALIILAVHLVRQVLPAEWDAVVLAELAFTPLRYGSDGEVGLTGVLAPVAHLFLHAHWPHLLINGLGLVAFGSGVERRLDGRRMLLLFFAGGVLGSMFDGFVHTDASYIGASGGVSALFGAVLRFALDRRNIWPVAVVWLIANAVAGQAGLLAGDAEVAWIAHAGGFVLGLSLLPVLRRRGP